jgi:uncharacterized protein YggE
MNRKILAVLGAVMLAVLAMVALPALAQDVTQEPDASASNAGYPVNTITVTGYGTVHADPDIATVDVGADVFKPTVSEAFDEANATVQSIIDALTALGVDPLDIQTSNLSVYNTTNYDAETGTDQKGYNVSNTVHIVVRDVSQVEAVIDAAINAGATTMYGLSFGVEDKTAFESQARELAMQDAAARAGEYASLVGGQLGNVIIVNETVTGGFQPLALYGRGGGAAAQSAVVAPGQSDVQIQVTVTYNIAR